MHGEGEQDEFTHVENMECRTYDPSNSLWESQPFEGYGNSIHPLVQNYLLVNGNRYDLLCEPIESFCHWWDNCVRNFYGFCFSNEVNQAFNAINPQQIPLTVAKTFIAVYNPLPRSALSGYLFTHDLSSSPMCIRRVVDIFLEGCLDLVCESNALNFQRLDHLVRDYHLACFDIVSLCALTNDHLSNPFMLDDSSCFLESHNRLLFEVDCILSDLKCSKVKDEDRNEEIVFYLINGDEVEYFPQNSFKVKVDFIFNLDSFFPLEHSMIKNALVVHATFVVNFLESLFMVLTWTKMCLMSYSFACPCRRRTIGPLSQTFDTCD